jgi:hypothetical protein
MAQQQYLALITILKEAGSGPVDPGFGVPGWPAHPIAPGGEPPGIWGGSGSLPPWVMPPIAPGGSPGVPTHPIVIPPDAIGPGVPTHPIYIPIYPAHPIVIPPDSLAPGVPTHPIVIPPEELPPWYPGHPEHPIPPIVWPQPPGGGPPVGIWPNPGHPEHPIVIPLPPIDAKPEHPIVLPPPDSGLPVFPSHPIVIPPDTPPDQERLIEWHAVWAGEDKGWVVVGVPNVPHPVPSK